MARTDTLPHFLTDVADAIREKKGTQATIQASDFDTEIENLPSGGGLDWSAIGYSEEPQSIIDGYNYAVEIKNNWDDTLSTYERFKSDLKIQIMPLVSLGNNSSCQAMFRGATSLFSVSLLNTSSITNIRDMFNGCHALETIPLFNTENVTNMTSTFSNCYCLQKVPILNTSKVTSLNGMFSYCRLLTDESLDNILQMCINSLETNKTLARLGFVSTDYPASRIHALPHYQDFIDAGWTIGY